MWSFDVNDDSCISSFTGEISKDINSKGSFQDDYDALCKQFNIIPCPYFKESIYVNSDGNSINTVKLSNTIIDISSWRVMLLAISTIGSKITEIVTHGICISKQHLDDLKSAIDKIGTFSVIKLEYITCKAPEIEEGVEILSPTSPLHESLQSLLSGTVSIDYISLKGTKLNDVFITGCKNAIQNNLTLQALNLTDTNITDMGLIELLTYLRVNPSLTQLSIARNKLSLLSLEIISSFINSSNLLVSPEEEAIFKDFSKVIGDRNKTIKDKNKIRKKAGLPDLIELVNPSERFFTINGEKRAINKALNTIDVSCSSSYDTKTIQNFVEVLELKGPDIVTACGSINITVVLKNENTMNIDRLVIDEKIASLKENNISISLNM